MGFDFSIPLFSCEFTVKLSWLCKTNSLIIHFTRFLVAIRCSLHTQTADEGFLRWSNQQFNPTESPRQQQRFVFADKKSSVVQMLIIKSHKSLTVCHLDYCFVRSRFCTRSSLLSFFNKYLTRVKTGKIWQEQKKHKTEDSFCVSKCSFMSVTGGRKLKTGKTKFEYF